MVNQIVSYLEKTLLKVFPQAKITSCDEMISVDHFDILPTKIKKKSIKGEIEVDGWEITKGVIQYNYPHEPDSVDVVHCAEAIGTLQTAQLMCELYAKHVFETMCENIATDEWAKTSLEEDKLFT